MRVYVEFINGSEQKALTIIKFKFVLSDNDKTESISTNAGNSNIKLKLLEQKSKEVIATFHFPVSFSMPHPDLCALAALKIISPYIGCEFIMDRPVSLQTSTIIKRFYPNVKYVAIDERLEPRSLPTIPKPVVSFSGGLDSVAASSLLSYDTPLILSARMWHPDIGEFEKWYNTEANIKTIEKMPNVFKYVVYSDFEFLSTNMADTYCVYPDAYAFTIPAILLSDFLNTSHIVTGDIWVAFNGDETIFNPHLVSKQNDLFMAVGLCLEPVINGIGELGSVIIAKDNNLLDIATTRQYGKFQKPCMKCIKCFRKLLYLWAIFGQSLSNEEVKNFNKSNAVQSFAVNNSRRGFAFAPTYKFVFEHIEYKFNRNIKFISDRAKTLPMNTNFVKKIYENAYTSIKRPQFVLDAYEKIKMLMPLMNESDIKNFSSIDYRKYLRDK